MHIQHIHIPHFRVLREVDIEFEHDFLPRIFPLGSQNGGGKSTLLQLIFTLLHCGVGEEKLVFLQNILADYQVEEESGQQLLAEIEIWDEEDSQSVPLRFFCCDDRFLNELKMSKGIDRLGISMLTTYPVREAEYLSLQEEIEEDRKRW